MRLYKENKYNRYGFKLENTDLFIGKVLINTSLKYWYFTYNIVIVKKDTLGEQSMYYL